MRKLEPDEIFRIAFTHTLGHEGGFGADPGDKGNWTGGAIGEGELKGTKFGISAMSYPDLDIRNLTIEQARDIYWRDFFTALRLERIADPRISIKLFDLAVNVGPRRALAILQRAVNYLKPAATEIDVDGQPGSVTTEAVNSLPARQVLAALCGEMYVHYSSLVESERTRQFEKYAGGWVLRAMWIPEAVAMVSEPLADPDTTEVIDRSPEPEEPVPGDGEPWGAPSPRPLK